MTFDLAQLRPFIAPVFLEAVGPLRDAALLTRLMNDVKVIAKRNSSSTTRRILFTSPVDETESHFYQAIIYREKTTPAWSTRSPVEDEGHELIIISVRGKIATICASDGSMRDRLVKDIKSCRRISRERLNAFVGGAAKALWLNGVHTPTASKADTKAITGTALEYALDPLGDQTYYYNAVRSVPEIVGLLKAGKKAVIGAAPGGARIWVRRAESWDDFKRVMAILIDHAVNGVIADNPFSSLSQPIDNGVDIKDAYGLSVAPGELLSEDTVAEAAYEIARRWAFDADFEVTALVGPSLSAVVSLDSDAIGTAEISVTIDDGIASTAVAWTNVVAGKVAQRAECESFLANAERIKIYYDSGHTIAQGRCYVGGYSDQPFDWDFRSFAGYEVNREKPEVPAGSTLAAAIGENNEKSLFAYVLEKMFVDDQGSAKGWLASDDGSMELADFIHIDPNDRVVTLVHVKASSWDTPDRGAKPGDYELVVAQAIKNLRHLDRRNLHDEMKKGKGKKIGSAVWLDGVRQANRDGFLAAAKKLPRSHRTVLVVLQPSVTKMERDKCLADKAPPTYAMRMRQIDTLLLSARASALACGASFIGIGDLGT